MTDPQIPLLSRTAGADPDWVEVRIWPKPSTARPGWWSTRPRARWAIAPVIPDRCLRPFDEGSEPAADDKPVEIERPAGVEVLTTSKP